MGRMYQFGDSGYIFIGKNLEKGIEGVESSVLEDLCSEIGDGESAVFVSNEAVYEFFLGGEGAGRDLLLNLVGTLISGKVLGPERINHYISFEEIKRNNKFMRDFREFILDNFGLERKGKIPTKYVDSNFVDPNESFDQSP